MKILFNTIMLEPRRWSRPKSVTVPLIDLLPDIKKAGFGQLEVWGFHIWDLDEEELLRLSKELVAQGMSVSSIGSYLTEQGGSERDGIMRAARKYFSLCRSLGTNNLRIFYGNRNFEDCDSEYLRFIDQVFQDIVSTGKNEGVRVMAEMHAGSVISSLEGLKRAIEKWQDRLDLALVYQPYEFRTDSALKDLESALGYIESVHLQNLHRGEQVGLSEGDVDYQRILKELASSGFSGFFVLEFTRGINLSPEDFDYRKVLNYAAKDQEWLRTTWKRIKGQH